MTEEEKKKMAEDIRKAISQLEGLIGRCKIMSSVYDPDGVWRDDIKALKFGIAALKMLAE